MTAHPTGGGAPKAGFGVTFLATIGGLVIAAFAAYGIVKAMTGDAKSHHHRPAAAAVVEPDPDPAPPPQRHAHAEPRARHAAPPRGMMQRRQMQAVTPQRMCRPCPPGWFRRPIQGPDGDCNCSR